MPIKSRTESASTGESPVHYVNDSPSYWWGSTPPTSEALAWTYPVRTYTSLNEYIEYENSGGTRFNRCYHLRDRFDPILGSELQHYDFDSSIDYQRSYRYTGNANIAQIMDAAAGGNITSNQSVMFNYIGGTPVWEDYDWHAFNQRAYKAMYPTLEGNFSILNFLWELRDFKSLRRMITGKHGLKRGMKTTEYIKHVFKNPRQAFAGLASGPSESLHRYKSQGWKGVIDAISHGHLQWEFAIKPLVSDLSTLSNILSSMSKRIDEFRDNAGVPQVRHYVEEEDGSTVEDQEIYLGPQHAGHVRQLGTPTIERHATMRYVYSIPYMSDIFTKIAGAFAMIGISPSRPSIVWNAIPFTFLVDWFVDVGDILDEVLGHDIVPADVTILDYCCSQKFKTTFAVSRNIKYEDYRVSGHLAPHATLTREVYQRERTVPTVGLSLDLREPSVRKVALANSLLWAVMGKRKRKR